MEFTAPRVSASGINSSTSRAAISLHGMVTDNPRMPRARAPATAAGIASSSTSRATNTQSSPVASKAALKMTGESECRMGEPITAATAVVPRGGCAVTSGEDPGVARLLRDPEELVVVVGEEVPVVLDEHVVQPGTRLRVERGLDRTLARHGDRRRRQAWVQPGVVRRVGGQLALGRIVRVGDGVQQR